MEKRAINKRILGFCGLLSLVAVAAAVVFIYHRDKVEYHGDESGWITSANYYTDLLLRADFDREAWEGPELGNWGSVNTHLGQFIIGTALRMHPGRENGDTDFAAFYDFTASPADNEAKGRVPSEGLLLRARTPSVIFAILSCILLFALAYSYTNLWVAVIATCSALATPLLIVTYTRAMTDVYLNFFFLALVAASAALLKAKSPRETASAAALAGICCGLATSVKITGFVLGTLFVLPVLMYKTTLSKLKRAQIGLCLTLFLLCSLAVIYILNPYFWPSLSEIHVPALAAEAKDLAKEIGASGINPGKRERYPQLGNLCRVLDFPLLFLRWKGLVDTQLVTEDTGWTASRLGTIHRVLFVENAILYIDAVFVCIGLFSGLRRFRISLREKTIDLWPGPAFYFLLNYAFILALLKLNWPRYYAPALVASRIVAAMGVYVTAVWICARLNKSFGIGKETVSEAVPEETGQE